MTQAPASAKLGRWLPVVCRAVAVLLTAYPAARKFLQYSDRVEQFAAWGFPLAEFAVLLSGVVEIVAILSLAFGIAGRFGAFTLGGTMIVALLTAGPNPFIGLVLVSSIIVVVIGTGPYSYWDPTVTDLGRLVVSNNETTQGQRPGTGR